MAEIKTAPAQVPMALERAGLRPSLKRSETAAAFVSQLLAERANLAPQRARRRNSAEGAVSAYADGAKVGIKRMPAGYRTSMLA